MNCNEVRELISPYIDNMLEPSQMMEVEKHLLTCDACKNEYNYFTLISSSLKNLPEVELPEEFDAILRDELIKTKETKRIVAKKKRWIRYSSVAAIFLVGIFSIAMYNEMDTGNPKNIEKINPAKTLMKSVPAAADPNASPASNNVEDQKNEEVINPDIETMEITPDIQEPRTLMKTQSLDEEMIQYLALLDDLHKDEKYTLIDWALESPQVYIINIELETNNEMGAVSYEVLSYRGQDGKLWKIE